MIPLGLINGYLILYPKVKGSILKRFDTDGIYRVGYASLSFLLYYVCMMKEKRPQKARGTDVCTQDSYSLPCRNHHFKRYTENESEGPPAIAMRMLNRELLLCMYHCLTLISPNHAMSFVCKLYEAGYAEAEFGERKQE
jgi:hypothetical protein